MYLYKNRSSYGERFWIKDGKYVLVLYSGACRFIAVQSVVTVNQCEIPPHIHVCTCTYMLYMYMYIHV